MRFLEYAKNQMPPKMIKKAAPFLLGLIPVILYFWYIQKYGVNCIIADDWIQVPLIHSAFFHNLKISDLWAQNHEHRTFFPNLIAVLFAFFTHFNTKFEMFFGGILLASSFLVLIKIPVEKLWTSPWMFVLPAFTWFSLCQFEAMLFGHHFAWNLVLLCILLSIYFLERISRGRSYLIAAIIMAVIASFSSLQGLFVWPCGIFYLAAKKTKKFYMASWMFAALVAIVIYFAGYQFQIMSDKPFYFFLAHLGMSMEYFLASTGNIFWMPMLSFSFYLDEFFGLCILLLAAYSIWTFLKDREDGSHPLPVTLILFGLLFEFALVVGRSGYGVMQASSSRYTTYGLVLIVGIYLHLSAGRPAKHTLKSYMKAAVVMLLFFQMITSFLTGSVMGQFHKKQVIIANEILAHYTMADPALIQRYLYPDVPQFYEYASMAKESKLSIFSSLRK